MLNMPYDAHGHVPCQKHIGGLVKVRAFLTYSWELSCARARASDSLGIGLIKPIKVCANATISNAGDFEDGRGVGISYFGERRNYTTPYWLVDLGQNEHRGVFYFSHTNSNLWYLHFWTDWNIAFSLVWYDRNDPSASPLWGLGVWAWRGSTFPLFP